MENEVKEHIGSHYLLSDIWLYFDSFRVKYITQKVLSKIKDKSITHNIFRISEALINSYVNHKEFFLVNKVLKKYN